jgi:hypothetical protein
VIFNVLSSFVSLCFSFDLTARDGDDRTCAHIATAIGNTVFLSTLLSTHLNLLFIADKRGCIPIHYAAMYTPSHRNHTHNAQGTAGFNEGDHNHGVTSLGLVHILLDAGDADAQLRARDNLLNTPAHYGAAVGLDDTWR